MFWVPGFLSVRSSSGGLWLVSNLTGIYGHYYTYWMCFSWSCSLTRYYNMRYNVLLLRQAGTPLEEHPRLLHMTWVALQSRNSVILIKTSKGNFKESLHCFPVLKLTAARWITCISRWCRNLLTPQWRLDLLWSKSGFRSGLGPPAAVLCLLQLPK